MGDNPKFGEYELSDKQTEEYYRIRKAFSDQKRYVVHIYNLYKACKNKASFKRFDEAIRLMFENYEGIEISKIYRNGQIEFGNYKRDKYSLYVKLDDFDSLYADYHCGILYQTEGKPLTPEELEDRRKQRHEKYAKAYLANIERFKGLTKSDLGKEFYYENYKGEIEHYKLIGAIMKKRKMPLYMQRLDINNGEDFYNCTLSLVVAAKKFTKEKENNEKSTEKLSASDN